MHVLFSYIYNYTCTHISMYTLTTGAYSQVFSFYQVVTSHYNYLPWHFLLIEYFQLNLVSSVCLAVVSAEYCQLLAVIVSSSLIWFASFSRHNRGAGHLVP